MLLSLVLASSAQASLVDRCQSWSELSEEIKTRLRRVDSNTGDDNFTNLYARANSVASRMSRLHANETGPDSQGRPRTPIWPEQWVYALIDAAPQQAAAVYSDYGPNFVTYFHDANLRECEIRSGQVPNVRVYYDLIVTIRGIPIPVHARYELNNSFTKTVVSGADQFENLWEVDPRSFTNYSPVSNYHVEGGMRFEPVLENGRLQTLVCYANYVNPVGDVDLGLGIVNMREDALNNDWSRGEGRRVAQKMVQALKVNTERLKATLAPRVATFCGQVGCTSATAPVAPTPPPAAAPTTPPATPAAATTAPHTR